MRNFQVIKEDERNRTIENLLSWLRQTNSVIAERAISNMFEKVDSELGARLREGLRQTHTSTEVSF